MRRSVAIAAILGLLAFTAFGQTAKLTAPKAGASWAVDSTHEIKWTWSGSAKIKLVLWSKSAGKLGIIKSGLQLSDAHFPWKAGTLEQGKGAPAGSDYMIRIVVMADNSVLDAGPLFSITGGTQQPPQFQVTPIVGYVIEPLSKSITVSKPGKKDVWKPMKTYALKWSWSSQLGNLAECGGGMGCLGCPVDVWLVPAAASTSQKTQLLSKRCTPYGISSGVLKFEGTYEGVVPNIAAGKYIVRVAQSSNPSFSGDSEPFTVKSTLSQNTGFVGPDPMQNQVDLALADVFFDENANVAMKIKNLGGQYSGNLQVSYAIVFAGMGNQEVKKDDVDLPFSANANEEKTVVLTGWGGFKFGDDIHTRGKFIPVSTRPLAIQVILRDLNDVNPANNQISKELCLIQAADIGTDGEIRLIFSPQSELYINRGTANSVHESKVKWINENTFEAELEVKLWNYGCASKTFDIWLYVDKLPGQLIFKGAHLSKNEKITFKQQVEIKMPGRCGDHLLVFIADPQENDNQPYPDSYLNNFINGTLKIICGGTVTN